MKKQIKDMNAAWLITPFIILAIIFMSIYTVHSGTEGVLLTWGEANPVARTPGLHYKFPIVQSVEKFDIKTQKYETGASASSKDLQVVTTNVAINYKLVEGTSPYIYSTMGVQYRQRVIEPAVQEVLKATTASFTAEELITKRVEVKQEVKERLYNTLSDRNILVEDVAITNFEFSDSFDDAIEQKVTAEQLKLKAERDLQRIIVEKEQMITQAQAQAEALRLQRQEVTPELIELRKIEMMQEAIRKWDGEMPIATSGMPFIDIRGEKE